MGRRVLGEGREPYLEPSRKNMSIILVWSTSVALGMGSHHIGGREGVITSGKSIKDCKGQSLLDLILKCPINRQACTASLWALEIGLRGRKTKRL